MSPADQTVVAAGEGGPEPQDGMDELARANQALQATIDATSRVLELDELVPKVLGIIADVFETENCGLFENLPSGEVRLKYWYANGETLLPSELLALDDQKHSLVRTLAAGFMSPTEYLGLDSRKAATVFVDHVAGTCVPEFDRWALSIGCELELNVGIASQGVRCATLCIYRRRDNPFLPSEVALAEALARQIGLALQLAKLSLASRETAVAREREQTAWERAAELKQANEALRLAAESLDGLSDLNSFLDKLVRAGAEIVGASGGGIGLLEPDGKALRIISFVPGTSVDGKLADHLVRLEGPVLLAWNEIASERGYWWAAPEHPGFTPEMRAIHQSSGHRQIAHLALRVKGEAIGFIGLTFTTEIRPTESKLDLLSVLARQASVAVQLINLSSREKAAAIARERQRAAEQRARELERASLALQKTIDEVSKLGSLTEFIPRALRIVAEAFGVTSAGYFEHPGETIYLRYWLFENTIYGPQQLPGLDPKRFELMRMMAAGFTVPVDHLGVDHRARTRPSIIHHTTATASPALHEFCRLMGWSWELNVPLLVGDLAEGAICLLRSEDKPFTEADFSLAQSLAKQIALAMQTSRVAERERAIAVAREQEQASKQRANELERMARALQETIDSFGRISGLDELVSVVLRNVAKTLGAVSCALYEHTGDKVFLRYWCVDGRVLQPQELIDVDEQRFGLIRKLAAGFTVPLDYLGTTVHDRARAVIVDHVAGTSVPEFDSFARALGWDLELNVPIVSDSQAIGAMCVYRTQSTGEFTSQEIRFAEALSVQLAMAMLAKNLAATVQERAVETVVAREQEQAAVRRAEELAKANDILRRGADHLVSSGDIEEFLSLSLSEAVRLVGANAGALFIHTGKGAEMRLKAHFPKLPEELHESLSNKIAELSARDAGKIYSQALEQDFTQVDLRSPILEKVFPGAFKYHAAQGHRVAWHLALRASGRTIGFMALAFRGAPPTAGTIRESLKGLLQQLALALELTRLGEDAKHLAVAREKKRAAEERVKELTLANATVSRTLAATSQSKHFDETLEMLILEIVAATKAVTGQLFAYDPRNNTLATIIWADETGHGRGLCPDSPPLLRAPFDADITPAFRLCIRSNEIFGVVFESLTPEQMAMAWPGTVEWHRSRGRSSSCAIPILVGERPMGMIGLGWKEQYSFSPEQRELLLALTNQAAMVMQLRELADSQRATTILQERARFAGQIHDTLAQGFTGTLLHLEALRVRVARGEKVTVSELQNIRKIAALGLAEARRSALAIRPLALDGRDLSTALQQLAERSAVPSLLDCRWSLVGVPRALAPLVEETLLNIAHEAVSNAIRHADASNIGITLAFDSDGVSLRVCDDGVGFDASESRQRGHSFGLRSMHERANALQGEVSVTSKHGEGTTVTVHIRSA